MIHVGGGETFRWQEHGVGCSIIYGRRSVAEKHGQLIREIVHSRSGAGRSAVTASWSRSLLVHGLDPERLRHAERTDDVSCHRALERLGLLAAIARPAMDRLFAAVGDSGCCVVLTDAAGMIVERRGKPGDDASFREWGLWTGMDWSEATEGTNGIGTCLVERRPVTIDRAQHFFDRNTAMSCMGAPLFDHEGVVAGVLDISSCRADLTEGFLLLLRNSVADAAHRIEAENFARVYAEFRVVLGTGKPSAGPELFAVDQDDLLIGATRRARKAYGLSHETFKKLRPIRDVLESSQSAPDLNAAERAELRRALAHADGNATQAARDLGISRASLYRRMARVSLASPFGPNAMPKLSRNRDRSSAALDCRTISETP
jgi:transcriptional regulator of acetoin/glycerol metabolism